VITASIGSSSVNFTETTSGVDPGASRAPFVQANVIFPTLGDIVSGPAGSTGQTPIKINVFAVGPAGAANVPNVLVRLVPSDAIVDPITHVVTPGNGPQIACSGNTGYTDFNGNANCLPVFSGPNGNGRYFIDVGGSYLTFGTFQFSVQQGQFSAFRILTGNNQSGNPGTALPSPLTARTEDRGWQSAGEYSGGLGSCESGFGDDYPTPRLPQTATAFVFRFGHFRQCLRASAGAATQCLRFGPDAVHRNGESATDRHHEGVGRSSNRGHEYYFSRSHWWFK